MPFTASIIDVAGTHPDRIAIAEGDRHASYGDLMRDSPVVYAGVTALIADQSPETFTVPRDIGPLPVIAISLTSAFEAATLVATLAGYATVTTVMDPQWPVSHRTRAIRESGTRLVITDDEGLATTLQQDGWPGEVATVQRLREAGAGAAAPLPESRPDAEPYCLIFTSGTTDLPKGFLRTRHAWRVNVGVSRAFLHAAERVKTIAPGPLAYSLTLYALVESLATGGSIWLQSRFDPIATATLIDHEHLERLVAVPAVLPVLATAAKRRNSQLESLRHVIVGGANLSATVRESFEQVAVNASVLGYYGAAEIGFIGLSSTGEGHVLKPIPGVELSVRDETGAEVPEGELGQLFVRVASQGDRYVTQPAPITGSDGWSTVNDVARLQDGVLTLEGRAGDIAITGGHKVSLLQIERALEAVWQRSVALTQPDAVLGERIVAVLEVGQGDPPSKAALVARLSELLAPQFMPQRFYAARQLPRTVGGKVRRGQAREELLAHAYTRL